MTQKEQIPRKFSQPSSDLLALEAATELLEQPGAGVAGLVAAVGLEVQLPALTILLADRPEVVDGSDRYEFELRL